MDKIKNIVDKIGDFDKAGFSKTEADAPKENQEDIFGILPKERNAQYDMLEIIKRWLTILNLINTKKVRTNHFNRLCAELMVGQLVLLPINENW